VNLFKQRKNKTFRYIPKQKENQAFLKNDKLESQWQEIRKSSKRQKNIFTTLPFMVLFLITILIVFYILSRYE